MVILCVKIYVCRSNNYFALYVYTPFNFFFDIYHCKEDTDTLTDKKGECLLCLCTLSIEFVAKNT